MASRVFSLIIATNRIAALVLTKEITGGTILLHFQLHPLLLYPLAILKKSLPKAQRTRGLSSSCQSIFLKSYHKFKHKSWSHFIFRISTKLQLKIPTKHQHYCNCNCNCNCNYNVQLFYLLSLETNMSGNLCH